MQANNTANSQSVKYLPKQKKWLFSVFNFYLKKNPALKRDFFMVSQEGFEPVGRI